MTKTINGTTYEVTEGTYIELDGQAVGKCLRRADWLEGVPGYEDISVAWPNPVFEDRAGAVKVEITGRTVQYQCGEAFVRVRVEFLDDDEPSTFVGGRAFLNSLGREVK